jgi:hypothetical protein
LRVSLQHGRDSADFKLENAVSAALKAAGESDYEQVSSHERFLVAKVHTDQ